MARWMEPGNAVCALLRADVSVGGESAALRPGWDDQSLARVNVATPA